MILKVKQIFVDKYTNEEYKVGQILDVKDKRGKEILAHPNDLVEEVKESKSKE